LSRVWNAASRWCFTDERRGGHLIWIRPALLIVARDTLDSMTMQQPWPWPKTMDALVAAPAPHRILMENGQVRVLEVVIEPGSREASTRTRRQA